MVTLLFKAWLKKEKKKTTMARIPVSALDAVSSYKENLAEEEEEEEAQEGADEYVMDGPPWPCPLLLRSHQLQEEAFSSDLRVQKLNLQLPTKLSLQQLECPATCLLRTDRQTDRQELCRVEPSRDDLVQLTWP